AEIVAYLGGDPEPRSVAVAPPPRADAGCTPVARLERVGPRSALAEMGVSCTHGAAARALYVVRLVSAPTVTFDALVSDPPGALDQAMGKEGGTPRFPMPGAGAAIPGGAAGPIEDAAVAEIRALVAMGDAVRAVAAADALATSRGKPLEPSKKPQKEPGVVE